ncbi:hypothetical protein O7627_02295 [Solwaraspora sp. WMMD1047]|uniref:hypothetical protein n=1 Tax=Solwaraspora sp. WMMD1047 TaxID=3016102 RepID=UPI0024159F7F|nr:hypothetical protein [Solwaraspora sp. WMMD1047]MDG4828134.1 hypothetical protein [Solwaraspora sp. WMMD1047]
MPSAEHESPVALAKLDPGLVAWLLTNVFQVKMPDYHHARVHSTAVQGLGPRVFDAHSTLLFCDLDDRPLLAVVFKIQRGRTNTTRRTWNLYVARIEAELVSTSRCSSTAPTPGSQAGTATFSRTTG